MARLRIRKLPHSLFASQELATTQWRAQFWNITPDGLQPVFQDFIPITAIDLQLTNISITSEILMNVSQYLADIQNTVTSRTLDITFIDTKEMPVLKFLESWYLAIVSDKPDELFRPSLVNLYSGSDSPYRDGFDNQETYLIAPLTKVAKIVSVYFYTSYFNQQSGETYGEVLMVREYLVLPTSDITVSLTSEMSHIEVSVNFHVLRTFYRSPETEIHKALGG